MVDTKKEVIDLLEEVMTEDQIKILEVMGYFVAPASTKRHLAVTGGLAKHSLNVCQWCLKLNESMNLGLVRNEIILATLLHDLCKLSMRYEPNILAKGNQSKSKPFNVSPVMNLGHGSGSVFLALSALKLDLSVHVATAIHWHMGFKTDRLEDSYALDVIKEQPVDMMLTLLVQFGDQWSTHVTEHEFKGE